jgi:putative transposase
MPRLSRLVIPEMALHVVQRGHNRQACFTDDTDYLVYLSSLGELAHKTGCALHAYCLMTNHVHLLLTPSNPLSCARLMRILGQRYAQYFNRRYERRGALWEGRYRSCLVDSAHYVLACYRYIELNPVRAGMVESPAAYRWSSYHGNAGRLVNKALTPHAEYLALSEQDSQRYHAYKQMLDGHDETAFLKAVRVATNGGLALLSDRSKANVEELSGRRLEHRKPGPVPAEAERDPFSGSFDF